VPAASWLALLELRKPNLAHTVIFPVIVVVLLAAKVTLAEVLMKMMSNIVFPKSHTRC
jgi:hypothetical protein